MIMGRGLVKIYAVEEVSRRYERHFSHLEVGPARYSVETALRLPGM